MQREFVVKVIVGESYVPVVIRASNAAAALESFAERQSAGLIGAMLAQDELNACGIVGVEERSYRVVVSPRL